MFVGATSRDRFVLNEEGRFESYGRESFRDFYEAVKSMRFQGNQRYFLHGAHGAGKPYILAALTCLLIASLDCGRGKNSLSARLPVNALGCLPLSAICITFKLHWEWATI